MEGAEIMEVNISSSLQGLYKESKKNIDMALSFLLDSMDPVCYQKVFEGMQLKALKKNDTMVKAKLGDSVTAQLKETFDEKQISDNLINTLLWIAILFPEI